MFSVIPRLVNLRCLLVKDALGPIHFRARALLVSAPHQNAASTYTVWGRDRGTFLGICFLKRKEPGTAGTLCPCASCIRGRRFYTRVDQTLSLYLRKSTRLWSLYIWSTAHWCTFSIILHSHLNLKHAGSPCFVLVGAFSFPIRFYFLILWKMFKWKNISFKTKSETHTKKNVPHS